MLVYEVHVCLLSHGRQYREGEWEEEPNREMAASACRSTNLQSTQLNTGSVIKISH
jgi:hypothetical protein